jgi:hypothetical protein
MKSPLQPLPAKPALDLRPGAYHGSFTEVDLRPRLGGGLTGRVKSLLKLKRWFYITIGTPEVFIGAAIIDAGLAANAFCFAVDLNAGKMLADRSQVGPKGLTFELDDRPGEGANARFSMPGHSLRFSRHRGAPSYDLAISSGAMQLEAILDASQAPEPLAVVLPLRGGDLDATQKVNLIPVAGVLRVGDRSWDLGKGLAGFDFTHGIFARHTMWRWAFGHGRSQDGTLIGFNLTDGLSDATENENVLWVGHELIPVGSPRFVFDAKHHEAPWQIRTEDGALDLRFVPKGIHREEKNLLLIESHLAQVGGVFSGTVRDHEGKTHVIEAMPGVTEDQNVRW